MREIQPECPLEPNRNFLGQTEFGSNHSGVQIIRIFEAISNIVMGGSSFFSNYIDANVRDMLNMFVLS